ncbi:MAG: hypothetical protein QOF76_5373 [Solirubrobacteraceae bacterium]|nr:hypothetical protein [Solirubrobacteraceae bacterium]
MTQLAHIVEEQHGDTVIVTLAGEIDATNVTWIGSRLRAALSNRSHRLIIDLAQVTYLDSAGIALVYTLAGELGEHQLKLVLVVDPESPIARMLALTGVDQAVGVHASRDAATSAV